MEAEDGPGNYGWTLGPARVSGSNPQRQHVEDAADARGASLAKQQQARQEREQQEEALSRPCDDDLRALVEVFDATIKHTDDSDPLVNLYEVADERGCQALEVFAELLADVSRGGEPPAVDPPR